MAGKELEQAFVKSGDVLLLYEDGHGGYVYSDITPRLSEYSCVCFYPVNSREDPGLPDVNCATFSVQLVNEKKSASGAPVHYGQSIKLRHTATGRFLAVSKTATARCEPNLRVELLAMTDRDDTTDNSSHFRIVPLHSDHALGNQVCFNQPVKFESIGVPGHFLHCSSETLHDSLWVVPDRHELNVSSSASTLLMILHRAICSTETLGCHAGKLLKLSETKESFSIIAKGFRFRNPQAYNRNPVLDIPDITADCRKSPWDPRDVCAQSKYTDPGKTWFPASLWQFEEEENPTSGEVIKFNNHYRIKHLLTQKYLALVTRCGHDLNVCPKTVCREAFKVVLKDRSQIGTSEQEDTCYDDTVFTPVSPDEQTSTRAVTEGTQILLRHKKTGMWLNVFHDTVFQWHDIRKRKDHFTQYDLQPYYEADADQRLLAVAKNPHHAFSVQECFMNPAILYEVSGILPILIMYIKETQKSGGKSVGGFGPEPLKLGLLKNLLSPESILQYHAFVAQLGVIELLLTLKGDELDVTFDILERFLSQASSYEKNRFNAVLAIVTEAFKKLKTGSGMEVKAALMFNNMSAWEDAQTSVKGFLKHIATESTVVLDILGRMCISGGKPVGVIQDAILNRLQVDSKFREMLYKMDVQDGQVVVYRESARDSKQLLSNLKETELHSLQYQLILFSRLLQGGRSLAVQVIVKECSGDNGFISFEEAIKCTKNENKTLSPLLHGAFIRLMRVLCAETLESKFNALEPPTWCFEEKETGLTDALPLKESGLVNQLMVWIKDFKALGGCIDGNVLLEVMNLLDVLLKRGYCTEMSMVEASFKKALEILQLTSDLNDYVNYDAIFGLIPLFFHLQMRLKVQGSFQKRITPVDKEAPQEHLHHQHTKQLMLQQTILDAMKVLVDGDNLVPHVLVTCYFSWMNLHRGLHKVAELTTHEVQRLITAESISVLHGALQNYPWLRRCLKSFATTDQSKKVKEVLNEFAGNCIHKGVPHQRNQLIYSSIVLDDILTYIFDPNTSFPMWCWCNICKRGSSNMASAPSVEECFRFLHALTYNNFRVQMRLIQHLDDILPYCEVYPKEVAQLLIEIFGGEPVTDQSDVFHIIESIHLRINERQLKLLLQTATRRLKNKIPGLPLLKALAFIATYDEADLPITRNQDYMMKNLVVDRSLLAKASQALLQEPQGFVTSVLRTNEDYLLDLTNLLASCAEGKSLSIDAQCQSIHQPLELLTLLCKPHIPPMKKTPFLRFLISVYMDCKGSVRLDIFNPVIWQQIWQYLQTVASFLLEVGNDIQQKLQQNTKEDVQEILINVLRPYGIPNSEIEDVDGAEDFAGALYYLVKGILPMLIEFYGPVFQQAPLKYFTHDHVKVSRSICISLLALSEGANKVFISPIHLRMFHVSVAAVVAALPREHIPDHVNFEQVLRKGNCELSSVTSAVKKTYDREHRREDEESERFKESLKEVLEWDEQDAFRKLLDIFQSEKVTSGAQKCTVALGSVLLWLYNEAPLEDWPIYPTVHGLASKCIKALELHVEDLKKKDAKLPDSPKNELHFEKFCEQFSRVEHNHLEEVLRIAAVSNLEKLANETLSFLEMLLDSHDNPVRKLLAESIESTETHFPPLGNFLCAVHSCIRDSITASKARIDLREEIEERRGIRTSTEKLLEELPMCTDGAPSLQFSRPSFSSPSALMSQISQTMGQGCLVKYRIEELIPNIEKLKKMLSIMGLMCDEQNRTLQSHLRKQPGRFDSVNIVGDVVELLHHIHAMHINVLTSQSTRLTNESMEIIGLILQALIEFCAGNYENQEVVVNRQISGDITWILFIGEADDKCELHILKAQAVELLETLMEEVAEGSKGLVEKLRADEKLLVSLKFATEEFHEHIEAVHSTQQAGWGERLKELRLYLSSLFSRGAEPAPSTNSEDRSNLCKPKAKQARFRAYHLATSLKRKSSAVEDIANESKDPKEEPTSSKGKHFCEEHSKSIEVSYRHEKKGEPIHTTVSFPYHPHDELREEMKERIKWSIDRSSPEDKLLDLVRHTEAVTKDIEHQKRLRAGLFQIMRLYSSTRHYVLLMLTFFLNLVVLFTFTVPSEKTSKDVDSSMPFPIGDDSAAVVPQPPLVLSEMVLYVFGAIHLFLALWMVMEYYAVTWPHFFIKGWSWWAMLLPRAIWRIVFEFWKSTHQRWKKHEHRKYFEPPNEQKLEASLYGWDSMYRLVFLCSSVLSLVPTIQGYFYCLCLLYLVEESDVLSRVLQAVTKNGKSLLWVGALFIVVLYIYAVISFAFIHESFFVENSSFPLFCENLGQCFVSVIRYGLLDNIGLIIPLLTGDFSEASWRLLYDVSFFIVVTTIGLNIIFGIIVDTFSELRDQRWNNEQDMNDRCHICGIDNYEFDRLELSGFKHHVAHDHNMWNYIYYYVYVSRVPVRDRTAIQTYVFQAIESGRINFFPRRCALVLTDRETEATTDDLMKRVKMATHDLAHDIAHQARGTREVLVTRLSKKLAQSTQDSSQKEDTSEELEVKLQKMKDEFEIMKDGVKHQIRSVQSDISQVQQELAKIATLSSTILQRLPVKGAE